MHFRCATIFKMWFAISREQFLLCEQQHDCDTRCYEKCQERRGTKYNNKKKRKERRKILHLLHLFRPRQHPLLILKKMRSHWGKYLEQWEWLNSTYPNPVEIWEIFFFSFCTKYWMLLKLFCGIEGAGQKVSNAAHFSQRTIPAKNNHPQCS